MLANFSRGDFLRYSRTISKFSKRKGESSSCVYVIHKRDILGNLTWKSRDIVKKCARKCASLAVLLSRSLSLFCFFDFLILWIQTSMIVKVLRKTDKTFGLR